VGRGHITSLSHEGARTIMGGKRTEKREEAAPTFGDVC
jgi:hypothetical protein